jgi:hypothetical protein
MVRRRDCVGQTLAKVMILVNLVHVIGHFRLRLATELLGSPEQVEKDKIMAVTVTPGKGMWMYVEPRSASSV